MTDKVKQVIWVFDVEDNKKKRINLQTLLKRVNHSFRHENIKYFESKSGNVCVTYWDIDANGYRTATKGWSIRT